MMLTPAGSRATDARITLAASQSVTMAHRGLLRLKHDPQRLFDVTAMPVIVVLLFAGVFGGAIAGDVDSYLPMLVPGVMVQASITASVVTGVLLRGDMDSGVFDRFRAMPIARIAPLAGSLLADVVRYVIAVVITLLVGVVLGYRPDSWSGLALGAALIVVCSFAVSWIFALMGVLMSSASAVQGISMLILTPLTFMSNAFVPTRTMPRWMEIATEVNPITHIVSAVRALADQEPALGEVGLSLGLSVLLVAVVAPLAVRAYVRRT